MFLKEKGGKKKNVYCIQLIPNEVSQKYII